MKDNYGYIRVAAAMPRVHVADPQSNCEEMAALAMETGESGASVVVYPELGITGYTCADLFGQRKLLSDAQLASKEFLSRTAALEPLLVFGAPVEFRGRLFNCAVVARRGKILGIVPKTYLAGNNEFYEPRWFESARVLDGKCFEMDYAGQTGIRFGVRQLFRIGEATLGVEICQDLWSPVPPSTWAALAGAQLIVNLSASNEVLMKHEYRKQLVSATSSRLFAAYIYCSSGYGESTQDLVWAGSSLICEGGSILQESERYKRESHYIMADVDIEKLDTLRAKESTFRFEGNTGDFLLTDAGDASHADFDTTLLRYIEPHPFVPQGEGLNGRCREILSEQVAGLTTRMEHIRCRKAVIGISGGLDSTLALLVTALAFDEMGLDRKGIVCVTMPGFGTTGRTYNNSLALMRLLGVTAREISIVPATRQHFADIGHDESIHDLTYENSQARERTQILMDIAGQEGGIVIGTGDLSELALGWCTYNGDHMSMYAVNVSIPKTLVKTLVVWAADNKFGSEARKVLLDVADTPISPELIPADEKGEIKQKTEDLVGPYELHDFYLYHFFRFGYRPEKILFLASKAFAGVYDEDTLHHWLETFLRRFFTQQFKRSCIPDGPKVGSVSLSPRGDWRMPSDIESPWGLDLHFNSHHGSQS